MEKKIKYCGKESTVYEVNDKVVGKLKGLSYQFVDDNYNSIQPNGAVCCKDFLQDIVFCEEILFPAMTIYNYTYTFTGKLKEQVKLILALDYGFTDSKLVDNMINLQTFLNIYEEEIGFDKSIITLDDNKTIAFCHFSKQWIQSPVLLSLYLLLVRAGVKYNKSISIYEYLATMKSDEIENDDRFTFLQNNKRVITFMQNIKKYILDFPTWVTLSEFKKGNNNYTIQTELNYIVHYSGMMSYIHGHLYKKGLI